LKLEGEFNRGNFNFRSKKELEVVP